MRGSIHEAVAALALGMLATVLFRLYPALDLHVSAFFNAGPHDFWPTGNPVLRRIRAVGEAIPTVAIATLGCLAILQILWPRVRRRISLKATLFLCLTLALGPGLTTNTLLKDNWGRPRPIDIVEFGGSAAYVKPWTLSDQCPKNCSFVSGEASGAFWLMSLAPLLPGLYRPGALVAGVLAGFVIGGVRVAFGGHFLSDIVFAGFVTFGVIWLTYVWLYRFRLAWTEDAAIEEWLAKVMRVPATLTGGFRRRRQDERPDSSLGEPIAGKKAQPRRQSVRYGPLAGVSKTGSSR